ncbi:hypothetical protein EOD43_17970 [Sphingomonas crocodyli]|uniref:Uncharacterized protein n=1 Tax=Sphingomonas crocodyli TaxID=1979270 RepID=A0A437LXP2_9SPHN|nr:hypothetical protein EOD43_17970 [Sphingomonas crocodyli]
MLSFVPWGDRHCARVSTAHSIIQPTPNGSRWTRSPRSSRRSLTTTCLPSFSARDAPGRRSRFAKLVDLDCPKPPTHFWITAFRWPCGPWRASWGAALDDARRLSLTAYNASRREHYLAVATAIEASTGFRPPESKD